MYVYADLNKAKPFNNHKEAYDMYIKNADQKVHGVFRVKTRGMGEVRANGVNVANHIDSFLGSSINEEVLKKMAEQAYREEKEIKREEPIKAFLVFREPALGNAEKTHVFPDIIKNEIPGDKDFMDLYSTQQKALEDRGLKGNFESISVYKGMTANKEGNYENKKYGLFIEMDRNSQFTVKKKVNGKYHLISTTDSLQDAFNICHDIAAITEHVTGFGYKIEDIRPFPDSVRVSIVNIESGKIFYANDVPYKGILSFLDEEESFPLNDTPAPSA